MNAMRNCFDLSCNLRFRSVLYLGEFIAGDSVKYGSIWQSWILALPMGAGRPGSDPSGC